MYVLKYKLLDVHSYYQYDNIIARVGRSPFAVGRSRRSPPSTLVVGGRANPRASVARGRPWLLMCLLFIAGLGQVRCL